MDTLYASCVQSMDGQYCSAVTLPGSDAWEVRTGRRGGGGRRGAGGAVVLDIEGSRLEL